MKNLNEQELYARLYAKRQIGEVTYDEISHPDYEAWGRARGWELHQAACLIVGLTPLSKKYFDHLINAKSISSLKWHPYYPISQTDRNRLQNIHGSLINSSFYDDLKDPARDYISIQPLDLLNYCKKDEYLKPLLSPELLDIVDKFGSHPSLDLPEFFSCLEINPEELHEPKKSLGPSSSAPQVKTEEEEKLHMKERLEFKAEISKNDLLEYDCRRLKEDQLARLTCRAISAMLWKRFPKYNQVKILQHHLFKSTIEAFSKELHRSDCFSEETIRG